MSVSLLSVLQPVPQDTMVQNARVVAPVIKLKTATLSLENVLSTYSVQRNMWHNSAKEVKCITLETETLGLAWQVKMKIVCKK